MFVFGVFEDDALNAVAVLENFGDCRGDRAGGCCAIAAGCWADVFSGRRSCSCRTLICADGWLSWYGDVRDVAWQLCVNCAGFSRPYGC